MKSLLPILIIFSVMTGAACKHAGGNAPNPNAATAKLSVLLNPSCINGNGPIGHGKVEFTPAPQSLSGNCKLDSNTPVTCIAEFTLGQTVTIKAVADPKLPPNGSVPMSYVGGFKGIPDCANPGANVLPQEWSCQMTLNGDPLISAVFCSRIF
jgi:hypothetical protein